MRQLFFVQPGKVEWRDVAPPGVSEPDDAIVRPLAVAACDLDAGMVRGAIPVAGPFAIGHEFVGEVLEAGDGVTSFRPGDRVAVPYEISCGRCARCLRGLTASCRTVPRTSMYGFGEIGGTGWGAAFTEQVRVPFADHMLVPLPDGVAVEAAASAGDNLGDAWRCVAPYLESDPGAEVLVVAGGAPSIGLYAAGMAVALGAGAVTYLDTEPHRLSLAERLGARPVEGLFPRRAGRFPVTVDASADPDGLACALRSTEPGGVCTSVGIYYAPTPVPLLEMYDTGITFRTGRAHGRATLPATLDLLARGRFDPMPLHTVIEWGALADALTDPPVKLVARR